MWHFDVTLSGFSSPGVDLRVWCGEQGAGEGHSLLPELPRGAHDALKGSENLLPCPQDGSGPGGPARAGMCPSLYHLHSVSCTCSNSQYLALTVRYLALTVWYPILVERIGTVKHQFICASIQRQFTELALMRMNGFMSCIIVWTEIFLWTRLLAIFCESYSYFWKLLHKFQRLVDGTLVMNFCNQFLIAIIFQWYSGLQYLSEPCRGQTHIVSQPSTWLRYVSLH